MPNYAKLRELVSHRVVIEYDTGAQIVGYVAACKPDKGPVLALNVARAELRDPEGQVLERHDHLTVCPNVTVGVHLEEGPSGRQR